jgi:hypothetical protein
MGFAWHKYGGAAQQKSHSKTKEDPTQNWKILLEKQSSLLTFQR